MNILFVHQNIPGQFKHLPTALAQRGHSVRFLTQTDRFNMAGVQRLIYPKPRDVASETHRYLTDVESSVLNGQQVVRALLEMRRKGWVPNLVMGHPGWGETLFIKETLPAAALVSYCEFFFRAGGPYRTFDPAMPPDIDRLCLETVHNMMHLSCIDACDAGIAPTYWQKSVFPPEYAAKIEVIFDGIDTDHVRPDPDAQFALPDGSVLRAGDEVLTYVARNLEPTRGFPTFMRALPAIVAARPNARVVVLGGDLGGYNGPPPDFPNWREKMLAEVDIDRSRVHFLGQTNYGQFLALMKISRAHIYLTHPFVLSWSCVEAMACGALVIGSDTPPVREFIRDGENGLLTDFFDADALAEKAIAVLSDPAAFALLRAAARQTIVGSYGLERCLQQQIALIDRLMK